MIKIALTNRDEYNKGRLVYQWLELPASQEQIESCLKDIGYPGAYFITNYDTEIVGLKIWKNANINALNEAARRLSGMNSHQLGAIEACIAYRGSDYLETAIENVDKIQFYDGMDFEELAIQFLDDGYFGAVSDKLRPYINTERLGQALSFEGYYEVPHGVLYTREQRITGGVNND